MAQDPTDGAPIAEDAEFGSGEDMDFGDGQTGGSPDREIVDLETIGPAAAGEPKPEAKPKGKAKDEEGSKTLPWDPKRQESDQRAANLEKQVGKLSRRIERLTSPVASAQKDLDDALSEMEKLEQETPEDMDDPEIVEAYSKKVSGLSRRIREARAAIKNPPKGEDDDLSGQHEAAGNAPTQEDFEAMCHDAEIEYGSEFEDKGRPAAVREIKKLGYGQGKWPSKEDLAKIVNRVYRKIAEEAKEGSRSEGREEHPGESSRRTTSQAGPNGRVYMPTIAEIAEERKRELGLKGPKRTK